MWGKTSLAGHNPHRVQETQIRVLTLPPVGWVNLGESFPSLGLMFPFDEVGEMGINLIYKEVLGAENH